MGKGEYMAKKSLSKAFLFFIVLFFFWLGAAAESLAYTREDIGLYPGNDTPGDAVAGVQVYCDGTLLGYAFDIWNYSTDGGWKYVSSNVDGKTLATPYHEYNPSVIWMRSAEDNLKRFDIVIPNLKSKLADRKYSIVIDKYYLGEFLKRVVETPYDEEQSLDVSFSLQRHLNAGDIYAGCCKYYEKCPSYTYHLYKILEIGPEAEIQTSGEGYQLNQAGEAYYNGSNYIIQSLPEVTPQMEGYQSSLLGWYDAPEGGKQYQPGDIIQESTVLYPHWNKIPLEYSVTCIDVIGNSSSGKKLGESSWAQAYDSIASGSVQGCIPLESIYYEGMVYTGCSEITVGTSGNTVYRYFDYAEYPVQIKDQISEGPNIGQSLGSTSKWYSYGSVVNGDVLGNSTEAGTYYPGYSFVQSTSDIVGKKGIVVYRYFKPVQYNICLDGNGASNGVMADIKACWYQENYQLTANAYSKEIHVTLDLQAEEASCDMDSLTAKQNFSGWAESEDGSVRYSDKATVKNLINHDGNCTLYAVWEAANIAISAQPKRMGYQFAGWSTDPNATSGTTEFSLTEDTTLYAVWKADIAAYHVEYHKETMQGTFEKVSNYQMTDYTGTIVSIQDRVPDYPGFFLDAKSSVLEGTVRGDGSLVLIAYYRRNTYHVTFEDTTVNTGELEDLELSGVFEAEVQIPEYTAHREGYYFAGWTADPETGQIYCKEGENYHIPNHNQKLYAVWKPYSYQLKFDANIPAEETADLQGHMEPVTAYYGESLILPACTWKRAGYYFDTWNTKADASGVSYRDAEEIDSLYDENRSSITLYAVWKPISSVIRYQANVPQICSGVLTGKMDDMSFRYGQSIQLPNCNYNLSGYRFVEWNTKADGSGQSCAPGEWAKNVFSSKEDNNFYAIWKAQEDTRFILRLEKEALDGSVNMETMLCSGATDAKLSDAVMAYYASLGQKVDHTNFINGYQVSNPEILEEHRVTADGESSVTLKLRRKEFCLKVLRDALDVEKDIYFQDSAKYETRYRLPESISGIGKIARYMDAEGKVYQSGEEICIDHDIYLMAQHQLIYDLNHEKKEEYVSHNMPFVLQKPQETVYSFEGWYSDSGLHDYVGTEQSVIYLQKDSILYPKWSKEKISYSIRYQFSDGNEVVLLGNPIKNYHSGDRILLPEASQVVVPEGYQFAGWYEWKDEAQTICTTITEEQYGDKIYCLQLKLPETPEANVTQKPDAMEQPNATQKPGETERPNATQKPDVTKQPNATRKPEETKQPNATQKPDATKQPNVTQNPEKSDEGTAAPEQNTTWNKPANANRSVQDKLNTALSKKEGKQNVKTGYTNAGIRYQLISRKKHTLRVVKVKSNKKVVSIPKVVRINGIKYKVTEIGSKAFLSCKKTRSVKLGANIRRIRKKAFYGMKKLRKIRICSKKVVKIEKSILPVTRKQIQLSVPKQQKKQYQKAMRKGKYHQVHVVGRS